jgi:hypothetical protein
VARKEKAQIPFGDDNQRGRGVTERAACGQVERFVGIDWSGRVDAAGQRRHIWAGVWTRTDAGKVTVRLEAGRTRAEMGEWLLALGRETPRMAIGIDCCFSYPAWFLRELGCKDMLSFWRLVAGGKGVDWLQVSCAGREHDRRFWGKPHKRPPEFCGEGLRTMFRHTDYDNKIAQALEGGDPERAAKMKGITPKSPFQIGGSGSVGTGSLRAIPMLLRLHEAGFRVWPVESPSFGDEPRPLLTEMYTRLMTGAVAKSNAEARKRYLKQRCTEDPVFAPVGRAVMKKAEGSEDAFDALVSTLEMVRHAEAFPRLRATTDPQLLLEGNTWRPGVG